MNNEYDEINNQLYERYKQYLESLTHSELLEYFNDMDDKEMREIIQDRDPVGKGDGCYEP